MKSPLHFNHLIPSRFSRTLYPLKVWKLVSTKNFLRCHKLQLKHCLLCLRKVTKWLKNNNMVVTPTAITKQRDTVRKRKKNNQLHGKCQSSTSIACSECSTMNDVLEFFDKFYLWTRKLKQEYALTEQMGLAIKIIHKAYTYFDYLV